MEAMLPEDYCFMPRTWLLPSEAGSLAGFAKRHKGSWLIVKPDGGCQGKGIVITEDPVRDGFDSSSPSAVAQSYVDTPFLIDNHKVSLGSQVCA